MLKAQYSIKDGFISKLAYTVIEENQVSAEDYALLMEASEKRGFGNSAPLYVLPLKSPRIANPFGSMPFVTESDYQAEATLSPAQVVGIFKASRAEKARLDSELPALVETYKAEKQAKDEAAAEARRIAEELKAAKQAQALADASAIEWNENGEAILNLYRKLETLSEIEMDSRFNNWIKRVDSIDESKPNGYCFEGEWVNDKTVEISNENAVFIVAGTSGSRKYATTHYRVIVLRDGKLQATDIKADSSDAGWALLIRDRVAALLS